MYQLFKVMKYIHSGNVIHRDLKPSNVLLNAECFVKLADFGLARSLTAHDQETVDPNKALMTDYVATRWYRAPEILLGSPHYTHGVDMWSLGCILGEMLGGKPVFSGSSTINQVERIMCHLPQPSKLDMESLDSPYTESFLRQVPKRPRRSFAMLYPNAPIEAIDLMNKLLQFNPQKRISAEKALEHAYVATFHNPEEETVLDSDVIPKLNDNYKCGVDKYRARLYESIDLRAKEGLSGISLDPHIHPVADPQCNNVATARGTRGSVSSSSESSLHTLKSHHSKTTSTPSREYKHGEQKSDKASTPGSDVHTLPPGSDVHTLPPGSDVHTLPPGSDVHTLPPGSDVHTLPPGSDVHTHPPGSDVRTHPTGRRIHKVASDKHSVGPRLADTGQVSAPPFILVEGN
jgi:mitogen-activated protein kinase 15